MAKVAQRYPQLIGSGMPYRDDDPTDLFLEEKRQFIDAFGCRWDCAVDGLEGIVTGHPLSDWARLDDYKMPDPNEYGGPYSIDWAAEERRFAAMGSDEVKKGGLPHGFLLLRAQYLRGFERLMMDIALREPCLDRLLYMLEEYHTAIVDRYLAMGADLITLPEDLGTQDRLLMGPPHFRRLIAPIYRRMAHLCHRAGAMTYLHSDGYILEIADDLIGCGFTIVNPQDLCNGIEGIRKAFKGRICIELDIDRQRILPFGTPAEIDELIETETGELGSPQGGLSFIAGIYPPTPPENVDALCRALIRHKDRWYR